MSLIDDATFEKVQQVLEAQRQSGERSWIHHHYLRGTLRCAECGRRLFFTQAKGRHGGLYDYFICGGRTARICKQPHHRVQAVEAAVERHYTTIQLDDLQRHRIRNTVAAHIDRVARIAAKETARAQAEVTRLDNEERKLLTAHYADKISEHIFAEEQSRVRRERAAAEHLLNRHKINQETVASTLDLALQLTDSIQAAYLQADTTERRLLNQAFFEYLEVDSEEITTGQLNPPFAQLAAINRILADDPEAGETPATGPHAPAEAPQNDETPGPSSKAGGSYLTHMVELNGTLSNREVLLETSELVSLKHRLLQEHSSTAVEPSASKPRAGLIKQAVIRVLDEATGPMRVIEIRSGCEKLLGVPVNRSTVSDCLVKHSHREPRLFDRAARGSYRRRAV